MVDHIQNFRDNKKSLEDARGKHDLPETITTCELSIETRDVLESFGLEAPNLINNYCIALEDALIRIVEYQKTLKQEISRLQKEVETAKQQMTNPNDV